MLQFSRITEKRLRWLSLAALLLVLVYGMLRMAWRANIGFQLLPVPDDDAMAYYFANFSFTHLVDITSPVFYRPRYVYNAIVLLFEKLSPNSDFQQQVMMTLGYCLVLITFGIFVCKNTSPCTAILGLFFLLGNPVYSLLVLQRAIYFYVLCDTSLVMIAFTCAFVAYRKDTTSQRLPFILTGAFALLVASFFRESMYIALVTYCFYWMFPALEKVTRKIPLVWKIAIPLGVFGFLCCLVLLLVPFVRWFALDFIQGKNVRMNFSCLDEHKMYVLHYLAFPLAASTGLLALRLGKSGQVLRALAWPLAFGPWILYAAYLINGGHHAESSLLGYLSIAWYIAALTGICWFERHTPDVLIWVITLFIFTEVMMVMGGQPYFLEPQVLGTAAGAFAIWRIWQRITTALSSDPDKILRTITVTLVSTLVLTVGIVEWRESSVSFQPIVQRAPTEKFLMRDLNQVTKTYYYLPESDKPWQFALLPEMASAEYNALFYGNPTTGVLAFRLGHKRDAKMPGYAAQDFMIPFPYGRLGKQCLAKETAHIQTLSKSVDVKLFKGEILLGAKIYPKHPRNLYDQGEPLGEKKRGIAVKKGHLYMFGGTVDNPQATSQTETFRLLDKIDGHVVLESQEPLEPNKKNQVVFNYFQAEQDGIVLFESADPPSGCTLSRIFFVDVTVTPEQRNVK